jgi:hypothetical protein
MASREERLAANEGLYPPGQRIVELTDTWGA